MDVLTHLFVEFKDEPGRADRVMVSIIEVVGGSFLVDGKLGGDLPKAEVKRRTEICAKWLLVFRRDLHWSVERGLDELPKALRSEMDGIPYSPTREGRQSWVADNARDLIWMPSR